jgi:hypothetical protein
MRGNEEIASAGLSRDHPGDITRLIERDIVQPALGKAVAEKSGDAALVSRRSGDLPGHHDIGKEDLTQVPERLAVGQESLVRLPIDGFFCHGTIGRNLGSLRVSTSGNEESLLPHSVYNGRINTGKNRFRVLEKAPARRVD